MKQRLTSAVLLAALLCAGLAASVGGGAPVRIAARPAAATSSAVTKAGTGPFSSLRVTVGQTQNLVDQVVQVNWSGGQQTQSDTSFAINYLQIMQCWGDSATGPTPDQCEFGGKAAYDTRGGIYTASRQLNYGILVDPAQPLPSPLPQSTVYVPFKSVGGKTVTGNTNEFYDASTTNEIPYARTRGDGKGQEYFETQTLQEAPGLGCGQLVSGKPRSCWLVVVPRGRVEVDGSLRDASAVNNLTSSPLSASNWKYHITIPLHFAPVGDVCPLGTAERRTVGVEPIDEAFVRWQPTLCAGGGAVYGFSQVTDSVANRQVLSDAPGMVFVNSGVPASQVAADRPLTYAPVALTGLTISYLIESQSGPNAPPAIKATDGARINVLNLTPRLVAKLLTQSYQLGVNSDARYLKDNAPDLTKDPDFLAINPSFKDLQLSNPVADMLVPESLSKTTELLWQWIGADPAARDFLAGQPDPWGMRINPFYQGTSANRDDFPKVDPFCLTYTTGPAPLCTLDAHPYAADMHDAARASSRGDSLARSAWDPLATPPAYKKAGLQLNGRRALIALADTATASRFGLVPARLQNAAGQFVAPTDASILLGEKSMKASAVPGVLQSAPESRTPGAYPLVNLTYAATPQTALSQPEANDYARLIRYAVGAGQVPGNDPGQLPAGYVPLPQALRTQALFAAAIIQSRKGGTATPTSPNPVPTQDSTTPGGSGTDLGNGGDTSGTDSSTTDSSPADTSGTADLPAETTTANKAATTGGSDVTGPTITNAAGERTPSEKAGAARYVLPIALILGSLAAAGGPALPLARRRIRR